MVSKAFDRSKNIPIDDSSLQQHCLSYQLVAFPFCPLIILSSHHLGLYHIFYIKQVSKILLEQFQIKRFSLCCSPLNMLEGLLVKIAFIYKTGNWGMALNTISHSLMFFNMTNYNIKYKFFHDVLIRNWAHITSL